MLQASTPAATDLPDSVPCGRFGETTLCQDDAKLTAQVRRSRRSGVRFARPTCLCPTFSRRLPAEFLPPRVGLAQCLPDALK